MHESIRQDALAAGLDPAKVFTLASQLTNPARNDVFTYPKPSGTKERRKAERQNKKRGRQQNRKKK